MNSVVFTSWKLFCRNLVGFWFMQWIKKTTPIPLLKMSVFLRSFSVSEIVSSMHLSNTMNTYQPAFGQYNILERLSKVPWGNCLDNLTNLQQTLKMSFTSHCNIFFFEMLKTVYIIGKIFLIWCKGITM